MGRMEDKSNAKSLLQAGFGSSGRESRTVDPNRAKVCLEAERSTKRTQVSRIVPLTFKLQE